MKASLRLRKILVQLPGDFVIRAWNWSMNEGIGRRRA